MPDINISVQNKIAVQTNKTEYICDNSDFIIKFNFDAEWDAYDTKTARFCYNSKYVDAVFTGDSCAVPIISDTNDINIGVYAGNLHTTTPALVLCEKSILGGSGFPADPPDDVYNQIMELIQGLGTPDAEAIAKAVADYLIEHPLEETDPSVPTWAKAEKKPTYTAEEVGAIANTELQTAINSALAQAKTSGEFDGAKGDPGKAATIQVGKVTTGAAGTPASVFNVGTDESAIFDFTIPQGKKGEDATADPTLGLTGATVGQIAKIAAVDASGVPTAWEPVDMPSGGGETWEKLVDVTLAEAVASVTYTFDNCKRIRALIAPVLSDAISGWKTITINNVSYPAMNKKWEPHDGLCLRIDSEVPPYVQGNVSGIANTAIFGINSGYYATVLENIAPNGITQFGCQTAAVLTAGTKIEIWGVKS